MPIGAWLDNLFHKAAPLTPLLTGVLAMNPYASLLLTLVTGVVNMVQSHNADASVAQKSLHANDYIGMITSVLPQILPQSAPVVAAMAPTMPALVQAQVQATHDAHAAAPAVPTAQTLDPAAMASFIAALRAGGYTITAPVLAAS